jgi:hypothetical protein
MPDRHATGPSSPESPIATPPTSGETRQCPECQGDIYVCVHGPAAHCDAGYPHGSRLCAACEGTGVLSCGDAQ